MPRIRIIAVGKIKQSAKYLETGLAHYQKRVAHQLKIEWVEVPEQSPTATCPLEQTLEREADAILKHCQGHTGPIILLSERGRQYSSEEFSRWLFDGNPLNGGRSAPGPDSMIFIIGGAYGTASKLEVHATQVMSLSLMTFPHQMVRLLLMEQLYRATAIAANAPYHK